MLDVLSSLTGDAADRRCGCQPAVEEDRLVVDANDCPDDGRLGEVKTCRATVVETLRARDVTAVHTRADGLERAYEDDAAALLVAAGRFADAVAVHDERLAERATTDPLGAAREATGRAGPVARLAAETGLAEGAARAECYETALVPYVGPRLGRSRVAARPPTDARLVETRSLETDATVRIYERPDDAARTYHLEPAEQDLDAAATATLEAAHEHLATGGVEGEARAPARALRAVTEDGRLVERLRPILAKHTHGYGVFTDLFADPDVSDAFATAPVTENRVWVRVDGEAMRTNVRLSRAGAQALASRFRRESGRAFSQADPTLDAAVTAGDRRIRVAGVTDPTSDGVAFAFRAGGREAWTLPALVANDTLSADAGALLSVAVERGCAGLVAGPRGAGKTTLLGALLWEVPPTTRSVVIEDTPELPVERLQTAGRDVQPLRSEGDESGQSAIEALRTALRLGSGALVVGEIRGEEAGVLYEAMRVGANDGAVLGTIHGDGGTDVRERVTADLGVPESSFGATDLLVTVEARETPTGRERRVRTIEEVRSGSPGTGDSGNGNPARVRFETLFERTADGLTATGRIDRGDSHLVAGLTEADEEYATVREDILARKTWLEDLVAGSRTEAEAVESARARRLNERAGDSDSRTDDPHSRTDDSHSRTGDSDGRGGKSDGWTGEPAEREAERP